MLLASTSLLQHLQAGVRNRISIEQNAQESAWRDGIHKSGPFIRLPLTAEVRRVCESSLPLTAAQEIYRLNGFWYISAHREHWYTLSKMARSLHNQEHLCYEDLCEDFLAILWWARLLCSSSDGNRYPTVRLWFRTFVAPAAANSSDWW